MFQAPKFHNDHRPALNCLQLYYNPVRHTGDTPSVSITLKGRTMNWPFEAFYGSLPMQHGQVAPTELFNDLNPALYGHTGTRHEMAWRVYERLDGVLTRIEQLSEHASRDERWFLVDEVRQGIEELALGFPAEQLLTARLMRQPIRDWKPGRRPMLGFEADTLICDLALSYRMALPIVSRLWVALQRKGTAQARANLEVAQVLCGYYAGGLTYGQRQHYSQSAVSEIGRYVEYMVAQIDASRLPDPKNEERRYHWFHLLTAAVTVEFVLLQPGDFDENSQRLPFQDLKAFVAERMRTLEVTDDMLVMP